MEKCVDTTTELEKWLTPCLPVLERLSADTLVAVATALLRLDKVNFTCTCDLYLCCRVL